MAMESVKGKRSFEEITASSLVKVDLNGEIVQETDYMINPAGFTQA